MKPRNGKGVVDPYDRNYEIIGMEQVSKEEENLEEENIQLIKEIIEKEPIRDNNQSPNLHRYSLGKSLITIKC